jgi:soluble lytic murein transglycosylase-like protein
MDRDSMREELEALRNLKSTYESSRDRNKEDLVQFISNNYHRVPIEVAELIAEKTENLCIKHGVNFNLIVGIIGVESNFDPSAVSKAHARGLMQVRHSVWGKELGIENYSSLHGIETGIDAGIRVFKHYLSEADGNTTSALSRYNGSGKGKSEYADKVYKEIGRFVVSKKGVMVNGESEESDSESAGVAEQ